MFSESCDDIPKIEYTAIMELRINMAKKTERLTLIKI